MKALYFKNRKEEDPTEYEILNKINTHILKVVQNINMEDVNLC